MKAECSLNWHQVCLALGVHFNAGVSANELKRIKNLEAENGKLKRMYAELALENTAIMDVLSRKL